MWKKRKENIQQIHLEKKKIPKSRISSEDHSPQIFESILKISNKHFCSLGIYTQLGLAPTKLSESVVFMGRAEKAQ